MLASVLNWQQLTALHDLSIYLGKRGAQQAAALGWIPAGPCQAASAAEATAEAPTGH